MPGQTVAPVPGIGRASSSALRALGELARRRGWDLDGLAGAISHESGWQSDARNPTSGAVGLLQWLPSTLARWDLAASTVRAWKDAKQIGIVERYFDGWEKAGFEIGPRDFLVFGLGAGNVERRGLLDDRDVLYPPGSPGALAHPTLVDADGAITVGRMRFELDRLISKANDGTRPRIEVPSSSSSSSDKPPSSSSSSSRTTWGGILLAAATIGGLIYAYRK